MAYYVGTAVAKRRISPRLPQLPRLKGKIAKQALGIRSDRKEGIMKDAIMEWDKICLGLSSATEETRLELAARFDVRNMTHREKHQFISVLTDKLILKASDCIKIILADKGLFCNGRLCKEYRVNFPLQSGESVYEQIKNQFDYDDESHFDYEAFYAAAAKTEEKKCLMYYKLGFDYDSDYLDFYKTLSAVFSFFALENVCKKS